MNLGDLHPFPGTRDYLEAHWFSPGDVLLAKSNWENREAFCDEIARNFAEGRSSDPNDIPAFSGKKYDDYGGYGYCIKPESIFEVGVAAGYSIAAMVYGAQGSVRRAMFVDRSPDVYETVEKVAKWFPEVTVKFYCLDTQTSDVRQVRSYSYDIVHIDGNHTYEGATNDLKNFGVQVSQRGLIVVDDTKDPNIERACQEFAEEHSMDTRFIDNHNGHTLMMRRL